MLIKSVLPSLPIYAMQCFELPNHLLRDMEKTMRDFWWHNKGDKRVHWEVWRKMCRLFAKGGIVIWKPLKAWSSRAYEDCILDMASGGCVMRYGHRKYYPVHSECVARTVDSKRGSVLYQYMRESSLMHLEMI
ncbi:hypothetical protein Sango_2676400 [Sesamum angolense]|uniref:Uncharacterized protein n=1 Tax=Sesamum angolense TaxID=2727404 RepID=A0AAE1W2K8_9LAMI|nr:hypothetical protein Sango_2676400 [Sesamum angolense]